MGYHVFTASRPVFSRILILPFIEMSKKLWVAITAHNPLERLNPLVNVLAEYEKYPHEVSVNIYINYGAQDQIETLEKVLGVFKKIQLTVKVAEPAYENWYLTWAHKVDLAMAILNHKADYYIYQENDMLLTLENFNYFIKWKPVLAQRGFEPGFVRYENYLEQKIPFDNHKVHSLTKETPNVWSSIGFKVPTLLVMDFEIDFFVQFPNPYYGAMILDEIDGRAYIKSDSYDPEKSYLKVLKQNWPIADRSSMGLCFENVPVGYEHRRCVPVHKQGGAYAPHDCALLCHDDNKYSLEFVQRKVPLVICDKMLSLP